ncbi:MAG: hypothetical protein ACI3VD_08720 [Candidatus Limivicinus sp.]
MPYSKACTGDGSYISIPEGTNGFIYIYGEKDGAAAARLCSICAEVILGIKSEKIPFFDLDHLRPCDFDVAQKQGLICRLISCGRILSGAATAYTEPCFMPVGERFCQEENTLYFLDSENTVVDKERVPADSRTFRFLPPHTARPDVEMDNTLDIHPYYVRFAGDSRGWLDIVTAERRNDGIITRPISVKAMHNWAKHARQDDPQLFFARWEKKAETVLNTDRAIIE